MWNIRKGLTQQFGASCTRHWLKKIIHNNDGSRCLDSKAIFREARDFLLKHSENYQAAYDGFSWPEFDDFNWAIDHFDHVAYGNTDIALWIVEEDGGQVRVTYDEMRKRSNQVANFLRYHGVRRGDRVLIMLSNQLELWEVMLACIKLGAVMIPATMLLSSDDLADRIKRGQIKHVVAASSEVEKFGRRGFDFTRFVTGESTEGWISLSAAYTSSSQVFVADAATKATDPMLLYFTSGTTSKPKLVLHSHQSYPVGHLSTMYWIGLQPGDVHWNISSPGWAKHAWSCFFAPWNAEATVFIFNYSRFKASSVLKVISECGVTSLCAPPTVWRMIIQEDLDSYPVKIRELVCAGEPLNPEVIEQIRGAWGITIRDGFGQTETTCQIGNSPGQPIKLGSMGRPMPGYRINLLNPEGRPADEGEIALDLAHRPVGLMVSYADDSVKTEQVMQDGHYHTGDVAGRDEDGYFTYVGRADDVFKSADYRISPFELESILIEHDAVAESAVIPSPDPLRLSVPKCFVTLKAGHEPSRALAISILKFSRSKLSPYKRIRRLEFGELPKTVSGKIRRVELRRSEENRGPARRPMEFWEEDLPELG